MNEESNKIIEQELRERYNYCDKIIWQEVEIPDRDAYHGVYPFCEKEQRVLNHPAQCEKCELYKG